MSKIGKIKMKNKENKNYTLYVHIFPNGKRYVGITCQDVLTRWDNGWGYIRAITTPMARAVKKYGWKNIKHEILFSNLSEKEAKEKEICYITQVFHSNNPKYGYNLTSGGDGLAGWKHSKETRQKMSKAAKGRTFSKEHIENLSKSHKGYIMPEVQKKKISESGKMAISNGRGHFTSVRCIETNKIFNTIREAAEYYGVCSTGISSVINGKSKTCGGFHWEKYNLTNRTCKKI